MKLCICFILFKIFGANAYLINFQNSQSDHHRSVNLALETVMEFHQKDHSADIQFLDNVQRFIKNVKTVIGKNKNLRRDSRVINVENLTDFIREVIAVINTYEEPTFQDAFDIFNEEIKKYHYRGCKFYELTENYEIRTFVAAKLDLIRGKQVNVIKHEIRLLSEILKNEAYEKYVKDLLDYINSLYKGSSRDKFKQVLTDLTLYPKSKLKRTNTDLVKIVRDAIRSIIFDHYTNLNDTDRLELKHKIETFWKHFKLVPSSLSNSSPNPEYSKIGLRKSDNMGRDKSIKNRDPNIFKPKRLEPKVLKHKQPKPAPLNKYEMKTKEPKWEESKKDEQSRDDGKRIEIRKSDYYKQSQLMRNGMEVKNKINKDKVWSVKYTKLDRSNIDAPDIPTLPNSQKIARNFQHTTKSNHKHLEIISTDESVTGEIFEDNSIEQYVSEKDETTHPKYISLYPEPISYKPTQKDQVKKIVHRSNKVSRLSRIQTLWVEESTGQLPRSHKQTTRSKNTPQMHETSYKPAKKKYGGHENDHHKPKHSTEHKSKYKHKPEVNFEYKRERKSERTYAHKKRHEKPRKSILRTNLTTAVIESNVFLDVESTKMESHEYKKKLEPIRPTSKHNETATQPTAKSYITHPFSLFSTRWYGAPAKYRKRYQISHRNNPGDSRKSIAPLKSDETLSIEKFERDKKLYQATSKMSLKDNIKNDTPRSGNVDVNQNVINRIRDLEEELKDVKIRIGDNKYEAQGKLDKIEKSEARGNEDKNVSSDKSKHVNDKFKSRADKVLEINSEINVIKSKETKFNEKTDTQANYDDNVAITKTENALNPNITKIIGIIQNAKETEIDTKHVGAVNRVKDEENEEAKVNLVNEYEQPKIEKRHLDGDANYEELEEWRNTFKKNTISNFTATTTPTGFTTKASTIMNLAITTTPTKRTRGEIFIPVSMAMPGKPSTKKSNNLITIRNDNMNDFHLPLDYTASKDIMLNSPLHRETKLNINVNNTLDHKAIEKELKNLYETYGLSMPTVNKVNMSNATEDFVESNPIRKIFDASIPTSSPQGNSSDSKGIEHLFTDPFYAIDDGLDFLKNIK